jgi:hypothetical protein
MTERVESVDLGVVWDPNAPDARLLTTDSGVTRLTLRARVDDPDQRRVELVWARSWAARMEPSNDEAISGHRLYAVGLREVLWLGEVHDSELIADFERRNRVHPGHDASRFAPLRHWIVLLKECTVEVVARSLTVERRPAKGAP